MFSQAFILLTIFSALPIYIMTKINPKIGITGYVTAAFLIFLVSAHGAMLFLCTNGIVGVALGGAHYYTNKKSIIIAVATVALTVTLSIGLSVMTFIIGIPIMGFAAKNIVVDIGILMICSLLYNIAYFYMSNYVFKKVKRYL